MKPKQFEEYIDPLLTSKDYFCEKALEIQNKKNVKRAPAKRWNPEKMNRAVEKMWSGLIENIYGKLQWQVKGSTAEAWINFLQEGDFLENLNGSILEIEFE